MSYLLNFFLSCLFIFFLYVYYKLTFWKRQGITNEVASLYNRFAKPFHIADQEAYQKYGSIIGTYEGLRPTLMICDEELVKKVLIEEFHNFPNHRIFYHEKQLAGRNIVVLENEEWKRLRHIISPVFSSSKLKKMKYLVDDCVETLLSNFEEVARKGEPVDIKNYFGAFSLDVVASTAFGTKIDSIRDSNNEVVMNMRNFFGKNISFKSLVVLFFPQLMKWFDIYLFDYDVLVYLNQMSLKILEERRKQLAAGVVPRRDFIQLLMEAEVREEDIPAGAPGTPLRLTSQEIVDQAMLFLVAGYDTSSTSLCAVFYCLALNQSCQERLFLEIKAAAENGLLSYESLNALPYLDAVIKESLRYMPAVPRIERRSDKNCNLGHIFIPKDTVVVIPIYALNHDPKYFESPETFDPNRFMPPNKSKVNNAVYLPFASGPRNCIGMRYAMLEMKTCIANVLLKFKFDFCSKSKFPLDFFTGQPVSTARSVTLKVTNRK